MICSPLDQEGAYISGSPALFCANFGSFSQERNCLSVVGAYIPGVSTLAHVGMNVQTSDPVKGGIHSTSIALGWGGLFSHLSSRVWRTLVPP